MFFSTFYVDVFLYNYSKTWTDARDTCRSFSANSNLVSIHSVAENAVVSSLFNGSLFAAWIGLSDRGVLFGKLFSYVSVFLTDFSPVCKLGFSRYDSPDINRLLGIRL